MHVASEELGIPIYNADKDGPAKFVLSSYAEPGRKLYKARGADLRMIQRNGNDYSQFEGLERRGSIVVVGQTAEKLIKADGARTETGAPLSHVDYEKRRLELGQNEDKIAHFTWNIAVPAFLPAVEGIKSFEFLGTLLNDALEVYNDWGEKIDGLMIIRNDADWAKLAKEKPAKRIKTAQSLLIFDVLNRIERIDWNKPKVVASYAKQLQNLAGEWGVKLPKDWLEQAKRYDAMDASEPAK